MDKQSLKTSQVFVEVSHEYDWPLLPGEDGGQLVVQHGAGSYTQNSCWIVCALILKEKQSSSRNPRMMEKGKGMSEKTYTLLSNYAQASGKKPDLRKCPCFLSLSWFYLNSTP
jgi:hypothetical protein